MKANGSRASTASGESSGSQVKSGVQAARASIAAQSPSRSTETATSPAFSARAPTGVRSCASHQAVPTLGWPANGSSDAGVKMRIVAMPPAESSASTKTVSLNPSAAAMSCSRPAVAGELVTMPSSLPFAPRSSVKTRRTTTSISSIASTLACGG